MQHATVMDVLRDPLAQELLHSPLLLVRGTAAVEIVDGVPDEFLEASGKSLPREEWPQFEAQVRSIYPQMARITIEPEWAKLLDFETRLPTAVEWLVGGRP